MHVASLRDGTGLIRHIRLDVFEASTTAVALRAPLAEPLIVGIIEPITSCVEHSMQVK